MDSTFPFSLSHYPSPAVSYRSTHSANQPATPLPLPFTAARFSSGTFPVGQWIGCFLWVCVCVLAHAILSVSLVWCLYTQLKPTSDEFHTPVNAMCVIQHLRLHFRHALEKPLRVRHGKGIWNCCWSLRSPFIDQCRCGWIREQKWLCWAKSQMTRLPSIRKVLHIQAVIRSLSFTPQCGGATSADLLSKTTIGFHKASGLALCLWPPTKTSWCMSYSSNWYNGGSEQF